jgi:actin-related protein
MVLHSLLLTRLRPAEVVFNPSLVGKYCLGVAEQIMDIVERCPIDTRKPLLSNVFLIGGNCSIRNFGARLKTELNKLAWEGIRGNIKVDAHDTETAMYPCVD